MEKDCWTTNFHAFRTHFIFQKHLSKKKMPSNEQTRPPQQTNPSTIFYRVVFVVVKCVTMFLICQRLFVLLYNHCYHPYYYYYYYCYKLHTTIKHCYAYIRRRRRDAQRSSTKRIPNPLAAFDENMRLKIVSKSAIEQHCLVLGSKFAKGFVHTRGVFGRWNVLYLRQTPSLPVWIKSLFTSQCQRGVCLFLSILCTIIIQLMS